MGFRAADEKIRDQSIFRPSPQSSLFGIARLPSQDVLQILAGTPLEPCFMSDPLMTSFTHRSHTPVVASIAPAEAPLLRRYPRI